MPGPSQLSTRRYSKTRYQDSDAAQRLFDADQSWLLVSAHTEIGASTGLKGGRLRNMDTTLKERARLLADSTAFARLPAHTIDRLAAAAIEIVVNAGDTVFTRGSPVTGMYIIVSGHLTLSMRSARGAEHVIELMHEGDTFGEAALLTRRPHLMTATAVSACTLLHIDRRVLIDNVEHDRDLALRMIAMLGDRLNRQTGALENLLFRRADGRLARFIVEQLKGTGQGPHQRLTLPVRKGLIASHLNMTQEHFSRTLHELIRQGLIAVDGVNVEVIDIERLREMAELPPVEMPVADAA